MNDDESSVYDSDDNDDNDDCLEEIEDDVSFEDNDRSDDRPLLNEFHSSLIDVDGGYRCAIKALGKAMEKSKDCGEPVLVNDQTFCEVRDWLMTRLRIDNSGRSGIAANITVEEFKDAKLYTGEEDGERYCVSVKNHKTGGVYGAAIVWFYADVYNLVNTYISRVRPKYVKDATDNMFVSTNGVKLTSSKVSTCLTCSFQREGVKFHGRISATLIRKSLASGVHVHLPEDQEQLAALAQHKPQTQAQYYRINDKVRETDIGGRVVRKFITMNYAKTEVNTLIMHINPSNLNNN